MHVESALQNASQSAIVGKPSWRSNSFRPGHPRSTCAVYVCAEDAGTSAARSIHVDADMGPHVAKERPRAGSFDPPNVPVKDKISFATLSWYIQRVPVATVPAPLPVNGPSCYGMAWYRMQPYKSWYGTTYIPVWYRFSAPPYYVPVQVPFATG